MYDQKSGPHQHHHPLTPKLKHTILITTIVTLILAIVMTVVIIIVTNVIESHKKQNQGTAISSVKEVLNTQEEFVLPENTSNIPDKLDKDTLVTVVAKNQPAVVRILTWRCADITILSSSSSVVLQDVCGGEVGSGSFISKDGYIVTNGHVVALGITGLVMSGLDSIETVSKYLTVLTQNSIISQADANIILSLKTKGDPKADDALQQTIEALPDSIVSIKKDSITYAVQLANEPMRVVREGDRSDVDFTDTIIEATLIDQDYDIESSTNALISGSEFQSSDVALLKVINGDYPYVELGSIDALKTGDQLTAIGFPGFVDNSINTEQWQTVPSITQGTVKDILDDASVNARKIITTTVKIAQGNSGGPAFNDQGLQIGVNTYGSFECEDTKCFGDGTVRDIADLKALLKKNNITLTRGGVTKDWNDGLDAYMNGNYSEALTLFQKVQNAYPSNYLVAPLARLAREQVGSKTDTSSAFQTKNTITVVIIIVSIISAVIIGTVIFLIVYFNRQHRRALGITK